MSISYEVKRIRQVALMSQEDFAQKLQVSFSTVSRWENGKGKPSLSAMKALKSFCEQNHIPYEGLQTAWFDLPQK